MMKRISGPVRALVVRQPHADQIARGLKTIELRSWRTKYRGDLLIVAGQHVPDEPQHIELPRGVAVCLVKLADVRPMRVEDVQASCSVYRPGLWAWELTDLWTIEPFAMRGMPGLFHVTLPKG